MSSHDYPDWEKIRSSSFVSGKSFPRLAEDMPTFFGEEPFPSIADAIYILGAGTMIAALYVRYGRRLRGDAAVLVEVAILTLAAGLLLGQFVIVPIVVAGEQRSHRRPQSRSRTR